MPPKPKKKSKKKGRGRHTDLAAREQATRRQALTRLKKAELIDLLADLTRAHPPAARDLEKRLKIEPTSDRLLLDLSIAISEATDTEDHDFPFPDHKTDYEAYDRVKTGLRALIAAGDLENAKSLALELMEQGSYQVEISDEGLMSDDIQEALLPVIKAIKQAKVPDAPAWATAMLAASRVDWICDTELKALAQA